MYVAGLDRVYVQGAFQGDCALQPLHQCVAFQSSVANLVEL